MKEYLVLFLMVILQNASFTLVSRARNSSSIAYHGVASVFSNGLWLLVAQKAVNKTDDPWIIAVYIVASTIGALSMHWFVMKYVELNKKK